MVIGGKKGERVMGPYAETVITTKKADVEVETDNKPVFCDLLIGLLVVPFAL
jgi:hypothetical protein